ncbi:hypothetical protein T265_15027, partial [Opisthorchis viverrini]
VLANGVSGVCNTHTVRLQCIICDSPARAFLKQVKGDTGYYGCDYCTQKGVHIGTRITFPSLTAPLRRDYDFRTRMQEKHHIGPSPMEELNFPMIDGFPPDYMHSVCLGLVRVFLILLRAMPIGHKARLSLESWNLLNANIEQQSLALSIDFPRKCRGVVDLDRWKASELRQFLLYIGPVVLRDILHPDVYECFMLFTFFSQHYANFLIDVSKVAVSKFAAIFGPSHLCGLGAEISVLGTDFPHPGAEVCGYCEEISAPGCRSVRKFPHPGADIVRKLVSFPHWFRTRVQKSAEISAPVPTGHKLHPNVSLLLRYILSN